MGRPIVFLSDLGVRDEFVGACHCVIERGAPGTTVIDLSHGVPPSDVLTGAILLADGAPYLPPNAVVLAIVDPGVGTERAVAVHTESGVTLVGPDNGLLSLAWPVLGGANQVVEITSPEIVLASGSSVFQGRDLLSPAAAWIAGGGALEGLGGAIDVSSLTVRHVVEPEIEALLVKSEVLYVDRFGNVRLNVRPSHLEQARLGDVPVLQVTTPVATVKAPRIAVYHDVPEGEYGVLVDSWGWVSLIRYHAQACEGLGTDRGELVWLRPA